MKAASFLYSLFTGKGRIRLQIVMIGLFVFIALFAVLLVSAHREAAQMNGTNPPFLTQKVVPPKNLDYNIIEIDTIPFGHIEVEKPRVAAKPFSPPESRPVTRKTPTSVKPNRSAPPLPAPTSNPVLTANPAYGSSSKMIVVNNLEANASSPAQTGYSGLQTVRLKVIVPQRTPITTGSLVEARVINESRFGNLVVPRRAKLLGTARLQNNRIDIDFREIRIRNKTYSCSGRAYDLKSSPGIAYNSLNSRAKQVLFDELKTAAAGVPVVGRLVNQPDFNPVTQEITSLDEGQEFYAVISNIF